jgi:hypothetical protein
MREELGKPFEHEERLTALLGRQRALAAELDLDKDQAGTQGLEASEVSLAACSCPSGPIASAVGPIFLVGTRCVTLRWTAEAALMSQDHLVDPGLMIRLD